MDVKTAINLYKLADSDIESRKVNEKYAMSKRYYLNENDITIPNGGEDKIDEKDDFLRKSDSRVSSNYHQLLVDQKASYGGACPPVFDLQDKSLNKLVEDALSDKYDRTVLRSIVDSSLAGDAWWHVWKDEKENEFKYAIVSPDEITPIYNNSLEKKVYAVRRQYKQLDEAGELSTFVEFWSEKEAAFFSFKEDYRSMSPFYCIPTSDKTADINAEMANVFTHGFDDIPFVRFPNNMFHTPDLDKYKGLIDVYDRVYNGFVNDVEDVQQVILVLTNYGGVQGDALNTFMENLKKAKAISLENDGVGDKSGVSTLQIDIPVDARNSLLKTTNDMIFMHGQAFNPTNLELGTNSSGVALKVLHSPLELKVGALESEYRTAFNQLIHLILQFYGKDKKDLKIKQTWERTMIQNWSEKADMVSKLADITSKQNIAKNNPLVEDWEEELKLQQKEDDYEQSQSEDQNSLSDSSMMSDSGSDVNSQSNSSSESLSNG
jgi:SPP1 family phage portal protein